jgi:hypothetical protein
LFTAIAFLDIIGVAFLWSLLRELKGPAKTPEKEESVTAKI